VSSQRSYFSCKVNKASAKCCLASPLLFRAWECSSMIVLVSLSLISQCLKNASSCCGNIHRTHGMWSAMGSNPPSFTPFATIPLNSNPCSSITPSEFMNRFPNVSLVMLLNATAPKYSLITNNLLPQLSVRTYVEVKTVFDQLTFVNQVIYCENYKKKKKKKKKRKKNQKTGKKKKRKKKGVPG
jgi:hypothetical protein